MAKENGSNMNKDLAPILKAEAEVRAAQKVVEDAQAKLADAVTDYMKRYGKPVQRKDKDGNAYGSYVLEGFIPVEGGSIELRLRRTQDGGFSGIVVRKNAIGA